MFCFDIDILCLQLNQLSNQNKMPHEFLYCWVSISISVAKKHFFCLWHSGKKLLQHSWNGIVSERMLLHFWNNKIKCFAGPRLHLHLNQCVKNNQWQKERHEEVNCKYQQADEGWTERERESAECKRKSESLKGLQPTFNQSSTNRSGPFNQPNPTPPTWNKSTANKRKTSNWAPIIVENRPLFMSDDKIGRIATFVEGRSYPDLI